MPTLRAMEAELAELSVDEILEGKVPEVTEVETPEEPAKDVQEAAVADEQPEQETPEVEAADVTDDAEPEGKFEKKADQSEEDSKGWTYSAYKDEKDKRQKLQGELETSRKAQEASQAQLAQYQQQQTPQFIDPIDDAQGFANQTTQHVQQLHREQHIRMSRMLAVNTHGKEVVEKAISNFQAAGVDDLSIHTMAETFTALDDPVGAVIAWNSRQEIMNEVSNDPAAYEAKIIEKYLAEQNAQTEETQTPSPVTAKTMPSNFASASNKGKRTGPGWQGIKPIGDILNDAPN